MPLDNDGCEKHDAGDDGYGQEKDDNASRRRRCLATPLTLFEGRRNWPSKKEDIDAGSAMKTTTPAAKRRKFLRNFAR
ncbi:unnamed protein product [Linum trigynum]|uniref:Uncharacterized protein n=1 Tax=Linum trigynum TaxID=586398 RepID=A0AAV2DYH3_9ROSI